MTFHIFTALLFTSLLKTSLPLIQLEGKPVQAKVAEPVEDHSLTMEQYVKLGMPSLDKEWGVKELTQAAEAMVKLKKTPDQLPRFKSRTSGTLFAKLIDPKNLELEPSESDTDDNRLASLAKRFAALKEMGKCYSRAGWPLRTMTVELVEFFDVLYSSVHSVNLAFTKVMSSLDKNDPSYQSDLKSFKEYYRGIDLMALGLIGLPNERAYMTLATRQRLAEVIEKRLPVILNDSQLDASRKRHRQSIVSLLEKETDPVIRSSLSKAIDSIKP